MIITYTYYDGDGSGDIAGYFTTYNGVSRWLNKQGYSLEPDKMSNSASVVSRKFKESCNITVYTGDDGEVVMPALEMIFKLRS